MKNSVIIKGNKYGLQIVLDPDLSFDELLGDIATKFRESARFFNFQDAIAVGFSGRNLTGPQQDAIIRTIMDNTELIISYVLDGAAELEDLFKERLESRKILTSPQKAVEGVEKAEKAEIVEEKPLFEEKKPAPAKQEAPSFNFPEIPVEKNGQFYRGTLRSGQAIEVDGSIVILGDINPGAQVIAGGNVVVLGCLKGMVAAGYPNDKNCFVASLLMDPMQIQIGPCIARSPDQNETKEKGIKRLGRKKKQPEQLEAKLAFVEKDNIFIETITRSLINEISLG